MIEKSSEIIQKDGKLRLPQTVIWMCVTAIQCQMVLLRKKKILVETLT